MSRRWKITLTINAVSAIAMTFMFLHPAAASGRPLSLTDKIAVTQPGSPPQHAVPASPVTAPAPAVLRAVRSAPRTYTVRAGDTLSLLARRFYGESRAWTVLYWRNKSRISSPGVLLPGQRLIIPPLPARIPAAPVTSPSSPGGGAPGAGGPPGTGIYSAGALESLWVSAGGPSWARVQAASVAECESGGNPRAYNPSGASGLWQILGQVVPGNIFDPYVNALNAVSKFRASGDTWAQWSCQPSADTVTAHLLSVISARSRPVPRRLRAFSYAKAHERGCPYVWGGNGPCGSGYDCSGLVQHAYMSVRVYLPRTVEDMVQSGMLARVYHPERGDLAVWFSGGYAVHTELVAYKTTWVFGAQQAGTYSGATRSWGDPAYYRVR